MAKTRSSQTPSKARKYKEKLTENLVVVLGFAPFQRRLGLFQITAQNARVGVAAFDLRLLNGGFEIPDGGVELLEVEVDARASAERFEVGRREGEGGVSIGQCVLVPRELDTNPSWFRQGVYQLDRGLTFKSVAARLDNSVARI
jgi:hypothetical protein